MKFISCLFFLLFANFLAVELNAIEVKIIANVDNQIITNIDIKNHQELIEFLTKNNIKKEEALKDLVRQALYAEYAKKIGLSILQEELNKHLKLFSEVKLPDDITIEEISSYIKNELLIKKIIESQVIPYIRITEDQVKNFKQSLQLNVYKLEKIILNKDGKKEVINLGWIKKDDLSKQIIKLIEDLKIEEVSKTTELNNENIQFQLLDKENGLILASSFEAFILENNQKTALDINVASLNRGDRQRLLNTKLKDIIEINYQNKGYKVEIEKSNLEDIIKTQIFQKELMKKEKELQNQLYKNSVVKIGKQ